MELQVTSEGADSYEEVMLIYSGALKEIETKLDILVQEFQHTHNYNPIEHVKSRIKTATSIVNKLKRHGYEATLSNMVKYCNDIAGIRIICDFTSDIYKLADMLSNQSDIKVVAIKDYIANPKPSGYMSYHMIVLVPVYLSNRIVDTKVEIQIRTIAMDFWASLEHKIQYKFTDVPQHIQDELLECSHMVANLDERMLELNNEIQAIKVEKEAGRVGGTASRLRG